MVTDLTTTDPRDIQLAGSTLSNTGIDFAAIDFDQWLGIGQFLQRAEESVQWWIGDWLLFGENNPEWSDVIDQAVSIFKKESGTLSNYLWVSKSVPKENRRSQLSWNHHQVVARMPPEDQIKWLDFATPNGVDKHPISYRKLASAIAIDNAVNPTTTPDGLFRCIVADFPWGTLDHDDRRALALHKYAVEDGCHLYLHFPSTKLMDALSLMDYWDFRYKCLLCRTKDPKSEDIDGWEQNASYVLFGTKGSLGLATGGLAVSMPQEDYLYTITEVSPEPRMLVTSGGTDPEEGFHLWTCT